MGLPGFHELEALREVLSLTAGRVPIIARTGISNPFFWYHAIEAGAEDYIFKDNLDKINVPELIVKSIIRRTRKAQLPAHDPDLILDLD